MSWKDLDWDLGEALELSLKQFGKDGAFWTSNGPIPDELGKRYALSSGAVDFDLILGELFTFLTWKGEIPEQLMPGMDAQDLIDFIHFVTIQLPDFLFHPKSSEAEKTNTYGKQTLFYVGHSEGDLGEYRLGDRDAVIRLTAEFLDPDPSDPPTFFTVSGFKYPENLEEAFGLTIRYPHVEDYSSQGSFHLSIPSAEGPRVFNRDSLKWALGLSNQGPEAKSDKFMSNSADNLGLVIASAFPMPKES